MLRLAGLGEHLSGMYIEDCVCNGLLPSDSSNEAVTEQPNRRRP